MTFSWNLFYISQMKGINNKTKIICRKALSKKLYHWCLELFLRKQWFPPHLGNYKIQGIIQWYTLNLKNKRSHHEPTYHDHRYYSLLTLPKLHTTTGQWLKIVAIKRQGVSSWANLFSKAINQVSGTIIICLTNQGIVL